MKREKGSCWKLYTRFPKGILYGSRAANAYSRSNALFPSTPVSLYPLTVGTHVLHFLSKKSFASLALSSIIRLFCSDSLHQNCLR